MMKVLLVVHLVVTVVMIGLILLQRSEGGGLGLGGGNGGMGSFAGPRAAANILTRATMVCFGVFVGLSLILAIMAGGYHKSSNIIDQLNAPAAAVEAPAVNGSEPAMNLNEPSKTKEKSSVPIPD